MDHYYNINNYRQRSRTLQPMRNLQPRSTTDDKDFLLQKFLKSEIERQNYANAEQMGPVEPFPPTARLTNISYHHSRPSYIHRQHQHQHHHLHSRSQSQHHYHTMAPNDTHNYTNFPAMRRIMHPVPVDEPPPHIPEQRLDLERLVEVCKQMGLIDSDPDLPGPRNYSIIRTGNSLFRVGFPQTRTLKKTFQDPLKGVFIGQGHPVSVIGPSKDDRSKFTICSNNKHVDIPHQQTSQPRLMPRWN